MNKSLPLVLILLALIAGCVSEAPSTRKIPRLPGKEKVSLPEDIQTLLIKAERSSPREARALRLRAAEIAVEDGDAKQTELILELIREPFETPQLIRRHLFVRAKLALLKNAPRAAIKWTEDERLQSMALSDDDQIELGRIRARAYYDARSYVASAKERIFIDGLLAHDERQENHRLIFSALLNLPADSLTAHAKEAITSDLRGWLSLAAMTKRYQDNPVKQLEELQKWKRIWSHHPAASQLPPGLEMLSTVVSEQPSTIALLLPLQGDLGPYGRAIRDGILAAHYRIGGAREIRIYDTVANSDMTNLVTRARQDGAELIIGPLSRDNVTRIAQMTNLDIPVLALNRTLDGSVRPNLYQFGLAPEDEMIQVANQVYDEGLRKALAIYPGDDWGRRNFDTFRSRFESLGGVVVDSAEFSNQRDYSDLIKSLLNVDDSEARETELRRITGQHLEFTPRRRQDIDFVFLLASQNQARGLNPTLAFFYADDLPVYSTSHVYEHTDSRIDSIDLNGIRFCDIPWKLTDTGPLQDAIESVWKSSRSELAPFYALGVDSWRLYPRLQQLKQIPDQRIFGATGILHLNDRNVIVRRLMWGQFRDGKVVSAPMVVSQTEGP